jgi:uncharacterized protein (UPF0332 family)
LTRTFPKELGNTLVDTKAARETYEYSVTATMEKTEAETIVFNTRAFVEAIKEHLKEK